MIKTILAALLAMSLVAALVTPPVAAGSKPGFSEVSGR